MESENTSKLLVLKAEDASALADTTRRHCGCMRTSDKLRDILKSFPSPPPPPTTPTFYGHGRKPYICGICALSPEPDRPFGYTQQTNGVGDPASCTSEIDVKMGHLYEAHKDPQETSLVQYKVPPSSPLTGALGLLADMLLMVQLAVSATALLLYYVIYCYMQLVYFALRTALYFHEADRPMKITIAVTALTALVLGVNLIWRMQRVVYFIAG